MHYYTYYTSFLFMLTGFLYRNMSLEYPLLLLSWTSTLHHSKMFEEYTGKRIVRFIDRALCHYIVGLSILYSIYGNFHQPYGRFYLFMYYLCLIYTSFVYYLYLLHTRDMHTHATIHISSCLGLYYLRKLC